MAYNNPRTMVSKKKSSGSGIGSLIGGMLGGAGITGGGFSPGVDPSSEALGEFNRQGGGGQDASGQVDEGASIDKWNDVAGQASDLFGGMQSKPSGFNDYKVGNPWIDMLFNKGQGQSQVNQMNFQQSLATGNMYNQSQLADKANQAAFQRQQMSEENSAAMQIAHDKATKEMNESLAGIRVDEPQMQSKNIPFSLRSKWSEQVGLPNLGAATNEAQARLGATQDPRYSGLVANNVAAEQQRLPLELRSRASIQVPQNTDIYTPRVGYDLSPNTKYTGETANQHVEMTGGIKDPKTGQMLNQKPELVTTRTPGSVTDLDAAKARDDAYKAQIEAAKQAKIDAETKALTEPSYDSPIGPQMQSKPTIGEQPTGLPLLKQDIMSLLEWIGRQQKSNPTAGRYSQ